MQSFTIAVLASAAVASASLQPAHPLFKRQQTVTCEDANSNGCTFEVQDYYMEVCQPSTNATSDNPMPDLNAPCNAAANISATCTYGADAYQAIAGYTSSVDDNTDPPMLSNTTQRTCVCESDFFEVTLGCADCYKAHNAPSDLLLGLDTGFLSSMSSSYCAATNTPTVAFADVLYSYVATMTSASSSSAAAMGTGLTVSDPIGNKTAVSYYFTPSITGSSAWVVAQATETPSNSTGSVSSSSSSASESLNTNSAGQIVPTVTAAAASSSASASASASSTKGSGAGKQEAGAVGIVIALAGLVAML